MMLAFTFFFYQNMFIYNYAKENIAKIFEFPSPLVLLRDIEELTFLLR